MERLKTDSIAILEYHGGDSFENPDARGRINYYGLMAYPTAKFDGIIEVLGGWYGMISTYLDAYDQEIQSNPSPCSLRIQVDYDLDTRFLKVRSVVTAVDPIENAYLCYAIAESHIPYTWWGMDSLHHVVRKMLPDHNGVALPAMNSNETYVDSQTYTLDSTWNDENCCVVVFLQRDDLDRSVLASAKSGPLAWVLGDADGNGSTDLADLVYLANYLFKGGPAPDVLARADANSDCAVNVADIVYMVHYLLGNGSPPLKGCA